MCCDVGIARVAHSSNAKRSAHIRRKVLMRMSEHRVGLRDRRFRALQPPMPAPNAMTLGQSVRPAALMLPLRLQAPG